MNDRPLPRANSPHDFCQKQCQTAPVTRIVFFFICLFALSASATGSIDSDARDYFHHANRDDREDSAHQSDILVGSLIVAPYLLQLATDTDNTAMATAQSQLLTGTLVTLAKETIPRRRPYQHQCETNSSYDKDCDSKDSRKSFFSGHTAFSFTTAGLMCRYENQTLCYGSVGLAATAGILRMNADKHFLSDVLTGATVGWLSGYYFSQKKIFGASVLPEWNIGSVDGEGTQPNRRSENHQRDFMLSFVREI